MLNFICGLLAVLLVIGPTFAPEILDWYNERQAKKHGTPPALDPKRWRMGKLRLSFLVIALVAIILITTQCQLGPPTWDQKFDAEEGNRTGLATKYVNGLTFEEALQKFGQPRAVVEKPAGGWPVNQYMDDYLTNRYVDGFVQRHGAKVARCAIWETPGGVFGGTYTRDYVFFDAGNKVIGYHARHLD